MLMSKNPLAHTQTSIKTGGWQDSFEISEKVKKAALSANIFFPVTASVERSGTRGCRKKYPERRKADFFRDF